MPQLLLLLVPTAVDSGKYFTPAQITQHYEGRAKYVLLPAGSQNSWRGGHEVSPHVLALLWERLRDNVS